jgi:hypothetical protein
MLDRGWLIERRYPSRKADRISGKACSCFHSISPAISRPDGAIHQGTVGAADGRGTGLGAKAEVEAGRVAGLGAGAEAPSFYNGWIVRSPRVS